MIWFRKPPAASPRTEPGEQPDLPSEWFVGDRADERRRMVVDQLISRQIHSRRVLEAMARVPRHAFVPPEHVAAAYDDAPLAIGHGQTISQPYIVAFMTQEAALSPGARVLEIGVGCGYQTAI